MTEISITRALSELKLLDSRIKDRIQEFMPCYVTKGRGDRQTVVNANLTPQAASDKIRAATQTVMDLMNRRDAIKAAIMASNATTLVEINKESMTVMTAIERKRSIEYNQLLLQRTRAIHTHCIKQMELGNTKLSEQIDTAVTAAYSNDKGKVTPEQYAAVAMPRLNEHELSVLDPIKLDSFIQNLDDKITGFVSEVDFVLSESNAKTLISIA